MYEFRYAKEHVIARTFHRGFSTDREAFAHLLFGLMVAIALKAQQSPPSAPAWVLTTELTGAFTAAADLERRTGGIESVH